MPLEGQYKDVLNKVRYGSLNIKFIEISFYASKSNVVYWKLKGHLAEWKCEIKELRINEEGDRDKPFSIEKQAGIVKDPLVIKTKCATCAIVNKGSQITIRHHHSVRSRSVTTTLVRTRTGTNDLSGYDSATITTKDSHCSRISDTDLTITATPRSHQMTPSANRKRPQASNPRALAGGTAGRALAGGTAGRALLLRVAVGWQRALAGSMCCWPRAACCWLPLSKFPASVTLICHP
ncbi:hypothetical protein WN943_025639 [Citrus x changshan-huyou]